MELLKQRVPIFYVLIGISMLFLRRQSQFALPPAIFENAHFSLPSPALECNKLFSWCQFNMWKRLLYYCFIFILYFFNYKWAWASFHLYFGHLYLISVNYLSPLPIFLLGYLSFSDWFKSFRILRKFPFVLDVINIFV